MHVPVANLHQMAGYALDVAQWRAIAAHTHTEAGASVVDALVMLLVSGVERLTKRGLERGYVEQEEVMRAVRGRIRVEPTLARLLHKRLEVQCRFEELTVDTPTNRLIASVLRRIARDGDIGQEQRHAAARLCRGLEAVGGVAISQHGFHRHRLHRNNRHYRPLIDLCELLVRGWFPDASTTPSDDEPHWQVASHAREDRLLALLFERFLLGYLRHHTPWRVRAKTLRWPGGGLDAASEAVLPTMRTDVSVRGDGWIAVLEAKFYRNPLVEHHDAPRLRSTHLYQLLAYLRRHAARAPTGWPVRGTLVYAQVDAPFDYRLRLEGFDIRAVSVDLAAPWVEVAAAVDGLLAAG